MRRLLGAAVCLLLLPACSSQPEGEAERGPQTVANNRDTMTRRQKDSVTATLRLPGAPVVGKALRATDMAKARADQTDAQTGR
jgi:hypothetical protein